MALRVAKIFGSARVSSRACGSARPRDRRLFLNSFTLASDEQALVALGDNPCWGEGTIILSRSFGEGLLARMTKDETRAHTAFETARAQQEKIV